MFRVGGSGRLLPRTAVASSETRPSVIGQPQKLKPKATPLVVGCVWYGGDGVNEHFEGLQVQLLVGTQVICCYRLYIPCWYQAAKSCYTTTYVCTICVYICTYVFLHPINFIPSRLESSIVTK